MIDEPERPSAPNRRRHDPLTLLVVILIAWNAVVLWLVYTGRMERDVGNDAAGAGMSRGFREVYAMAAAIGVAVLALPFFVIRHRGIRVTLVAVLGLASFLTPMML